MQIIDNNSHLWGDDLKQALTKGSRVKIAASCFSIYAYEALKSELSRIESLQFIFTAPTFTPNGATDRLAKERREFFIPKARRESGLYGTEFEIQLRNKLTQRAVARECAEWIRKKAKFRSNGTKAPMQQFMHVGGTAEAVAYMPISGFTAVDLGYQKGDAVSNFVTRFDDPSHAQMDDFNRPFFSLQIEGSKTGLELPGIVDEIVTLADIRPAEGAPYRAFVCTTLNEFGFPAKDRSGRLTTIEPAHLGRLMDKIRGPLSAPPAARLDFELPDTNPAQAGA